MLEIGIHDGDVGCMACQYAFNSCASQTAAADSADAAHAPVAGPDALGKRCRAVRGIVVDEHDLPFNAEERVRETIDENWNVWFLIKCRNHDSNLRHAEGCRRVRFMDKINRVHQGGSHSRSPSPQYRQTTEFWPISVSARSIPIEGTIQSALH